MAVVKITNELVAQVGDRVHALYVPKFTALEAKRPQFAEAVWRAFSEAIQLTHHSTGVPEGWMPKADDISVSAFAASHSYSDSYGFATNLSLPYADIDGAVPGVSYRGFSSYSHPSMRFHPAVLVNTPHHPLHDVAVSILQHTEMLDTLLKERDKAIRDVRAVLESVSTLAPALRAYPALWDLLPEQTKKKHAEVVNRAKTEVKVAQIDIGNVSAILATNKMLGGK